jgi:GLPGLI family protein
MKKYIVRIACVLFFTNSFSQHEAAKTISIRYERVVDNRPEANVVHKGNYILNLLVDQKKSFCNEEIITAPAITNEENKSGGSLQWKPTGKNLQLVYKDYNKNEMFLKGNINFRFLVIKDSINIFHWEIKEMKKEILGFSCQLATSSFRGRNYEAWFTEQLPSGGPWKFDDLPGMILAVKSVDNYLSWEAVAVKIKNENVDLEKTENPFKGDKSLSWGDFKKLYKEKAIATSKTKTQSGEEIRVVTPRMTIERYIEEDDTEYKADKDFEKLMKQNNSK